MITFSINESNKIFFFKTIDLYDNNYQPKLISHTDIFGKGVSNDRNSVMDIVKRNSSLKINFGFSYESGWLLKGSVANVTNKLSVKYPDFVQHLGSDHTGSWLGFIPLNTVDTVYKTISELVELNSILSLYQNDFCKEFVKDEIFVSHALTRNNEYRFRFFKDRRHDSEQLTAAFELYLNAHKLTLGKQAIFKDSIEGDIGCHYLKHPDLFFELLNIHTLKGNICV